MVAKQARRKELFTAGKNSMAMVYPLLRASFLCWKACTAASRMEHEALREMHAVEELSSNLAVSMKRTGVRYVTLIPST